MTEATDESERVNKLEEMYDNMFSYRYTDDDPEYVATSSKPIPPCPCVDGYFAKSQRNFDRNRGCRGGFRGGQGQWNRGQGQDYGRRYDGNRRGYQEQYQGQRGRDNYERYERGYQNYDRSQQQDYKRPRYNDR